MPGGVMTTGGLSQTWIQDFKKVFMDEYTRPERQYTKFMNVSSNNKDRYIKEGLMVSLGAGQDMGEGEPINFDSYDQGPEKTVYFEVTGLGVQTTREAYEDDRTGHLKKVMSELGKSAHYTQEIKAHDILNGAFVTTNRTGLDERALIANDHPLYGPDGGTHSNLVTGTLSKTTYQAAADVHENMVNERGIPIPMDRGLLLVIPSALRWKAKELMLSEYDPESAENAVNTIKNYGEYVVSNYLTSSTAWYLINKREADLRWINRRAIEFRNEKMDFNTDNIMWKYTFRALATFFHWRGVVGSTGV